MRVTVLLRFAQQNKKHLVDDDIPSEVPKPFTLPPGYKPPTLGEQWRYAMQKHPYYRHGYAAAILLGILGYTVSTMMGHDDGPKENKKTMAG
jgi:hypothetical protein